MDEDLYPSWPILRWWTLEIIKEFCPESREPNLCIAGNEKAQSGLGSLEHSEPCVKDDARTSSTEVSET